MDLLDHYLPLFAHTLITLNDPESNAESLRQALITIYDTAHHQMSQRNYIQQDICAASSAVLICLDEIIHCSGHSLARCWKNNPLQKEMQGKSLGGVHFFEQLAEIKDDNNQLRILHLFCLFIGYKGRYVNDDKSALDYIINQHIQKLPSEYECCLTNDEMKIWNFHPPKSKKNKKKPVLGIFIMLTMLVAYICMNLMLII